jgi:hypothetical protein
MVRRKEENRRKSTTKKRAGKRSFQFVNIAEKILI